MLHFGALEAGGTKMVCAIGNAQGEILERISLPTREPENTMPEILAFFRERDVAAVGRWIWTGAPLPMETSRHRRSCNGGTSPWCGASRRAWVCRWALIRM